MSDKLLSPKKAYEQIASMFGEENIFLDPREIPPVDIIPTPSPSLDRALGVGGWPRGRMIQLAGAPSAGKTLLALLSSAIWQSMDPENCACFIDAEYTYDPDWAEMLGIDNDRMMLIKTNDAEKIFTGLVGKTVKSAKTVKHTAGLLDMIEMGQVISAKTGNDEVRSFDLSKMGVITIDSIASMNTPTEANSEVGKQNVASMARFLTAELKKLTPAVARANVVMFGLNHVKTAIGVMYGDPNTTPGGRAWKHACSLMVMVSPILRKECLILNDNDERIGHMVRAKIMKNKVASPFKQAEYTIEYLKGVINKGGELFEAGLLENLFERPNNRAYIFNGETIVGKDNFISWLNENVEEVETALRASYLSKDTDDSAKVNTVHEIPANPFDDDED